MRQRSNTLLENISGRIRGTQGRKARIQVSQPSIWISDGIQRTWIRLNIHKPKQRKGFERNTLSGKILEETQVSIFEDVFSPHPQSWWDNWQCPCRVCTRRSSPVLCLWEQLSHWKRDCSMVHDDYHWTLILRLTATIIAHQVYKGPLLGL